MTLRILIPALTLAMLTGSQGGRSAAAVEPDGLTLVDAAGNIRKPPDYRDRYQILGTFMVLDPIPMVADAKPSGNEMHYTYASPGTAEFYRKNGRFADGTVLVKEVLATSHAQLTTGDAHWAKGTKHWFVMIKDEKGASPAIRCGPMGGAGRSSSPTRRTDRSRRTTGETASPATSRRRARTGFTSRVIRFLANSEQHGTKSRRSGNARLAPISQNCLGRISDSCMILPATRVPCVRTNALP